MTTLSDAPLREACRRAAARTLLVDLAALQRRNPATRELVKRRLIDHLPLRKAITVELLLGLIPAGRRITPFPAGMILDELERRRAESEALGR